MSRKWRIFACVFVALVLAITFLFPTERGAESVITIEEKDDLARQVHNNNVQQIQTEEHKEDIPPETKKEESGTPIYEENMEEEVSQQPYVENPYCTLLVRCDLAIKARDKLSPGKIAILPPDGEIYKERRVEFEEGETAFDVLLREMQKNNIHMEFQNTPGIQAAYIEGIANLYEFDCGELSGWMYLVNGEILSVSCSKYEIKNGDRIEFRYTCNMGNDFY